MTDDQILELARQVYDRMSNGCGACSLGLPLPCDEEDGCAPRDVQVGWIADLAEEARDENLEVVQRLRRLLQPVLKHVRRALYRMHDPMGIPDSWIEEAQKALEDTEEKR
jgi:hypothetical protein